MIDFIVSTPDPSGIALSLGTSTDLSAAFHLVKSAERPRFDLTGAAPKVVEGSSQTNIRLERFEVLIGAFDITAAVLSMDSSVAVDKQLECKLQITRVPGISVQLLQAATPVTIRHFGYGDELVWTLKGWITSAPQYDNSSQSISVDIGGRVALSQIQPTFKQYCGAPPTTSGELVRIYSEANALNVHPIPAGHQLQEKVDNFTNSGISLISEALAPLDLDVYEDFSGEIKIKPRRPPNIHPIRIRKDEMLALEYSGSAQLVPLEVLAVNDFNEPQEDSAISYTSYSDDYEASNNLTWLKGGCTYTEVSISYVGSTESVREEKTYGYVPVAPQVFVKDLEFTQCSVTSQVPTQLKLLFTKTTTKQIATVRSGYQLVWRTDTELQGYYTYSQNVPRSPNDPNSSPEERWTFLNGLIETTTEITRNEEQTNPQLCAKDQLWLKVGYDRYTFGILDNGKYALKAHEQIEFGSNNRNLADLATTRYFLGSPTWVKSRRLGTFHQATGKFIYSPWTKTPEAAPNSDFIRSSSTSIRVAGYFNGANLY